MVPLRLERRDFKVGNQLVYTKGKLREPLIRKGTITKVTARFKTSRTVGEGERDRCSGDAELSLKLTRRGVGDGERGVGRNGRGIGGNPIGPEES